MVMVVKWRFDDPTDASFAIFEVNPNADGSQTLTKNLTTESSLVAGGATFFFEGALAVPEVTFSGSVLTQTGYNMMVTWFKKLHQFQLTDDLGRVMMVMITKFDPKRVRTPAIPWNHTYTCTATIVNWL